ncbi:MAG: methyltransferase [Reyranella sp.]
MSKLTKKQAKAHAEAVALVKRGDLTIDEKFFVLENWREDARHINSQAGAFFTPWELARDFAIEVHGRRIIDLCAGIGALGFMYSLGKDAIDLTCVEINPDYVAVGRAILPEATWICGDALALPDLGRFDCAIGNPPFGAIKRSVEGSKYRGRSFEYHVIEAASRVADYGAFIVPQMSAPFIYSGTNSYKATNPDEYAKFSAATGIVLEPNCGIDTSTYADQWRGTSPKVEIVLAEFVKPVPAVETGQLDMFDRREAA